MQLVLPGVGRVRRCKKRQLPGKKSSRAMHVQLTPAGWTYCNQVIAWLPPIVKKSKADMFLHWLMPRLKNIFGSKTRRRRVLAISSIRAGPVPELLPTLRRNEPPIREKARTAFRFEHRATHPHRFCLELGGGKLRGGANPDCRTSASRLADVAHDELTESARELFPPS